jgi:hypothetical protein
MSQYNPTMISRMTTEDPPEDLTRDTTTQMMKNLTGLVMRTTELIILSISVFI